MFVGYLFVIRLWFLSKKNKNLLNSLTHTNKHTRLNIIQYCSHISLMLCFSVRRCMFNLILPMQTCKRRLKMLFKCHFLWNLSRIKNTLIWKFSIIRRDFSWIIFPSLFVLCRSSPCIYGTSLHSFGAQNHEQIKVAGDLRINRETRFKQKVSTNPNTYILFSILHWKPISPFFSDKVIQVIQNENSL